MARPETKRGQRHTESKTMKEHMSTRSGREEGHTKHASTVGQPDHNPSMPGISQKRLVPDYGVIASASVSVLIVSIRATALSRSRYCGGSAVAAGRFRHCDGVSAPLGALAGT